MKQLYIYLTAMIIMATPGICGDEYCKVYVKESFGAPYILGPTGISAHAPNDKTRAKYTDLNYFEISHVAPGSPADGLIELTARRKGTTLSRMILVDAVQMGAPADGLLHQGDVIIGAHGKRFDSGVTKAFATGA